MVQVVENVRRGSKSGSEERSLRKAVDSGMGKTHEKDGVKLKVGPAVKGGRGRRQCSSGEVPTSGSTSEKVEVVGSVVCAGSTKKAGQSVQCETR